MILGVGTDLVDIRRVEPAMRLTGGALCRPQAIVPTGFEAHIDLAITDEYPMAQAVAVISAVQMRNG